MSVVLCLGIPLRLPSPASTEKSIKATESPDPRSCHQGAPGEVLSGRVVGGSPLSPHFPKLVVQFPFVRSSTAWPRATLPRNSHPQGPGQGGREWRLRLVGSGWNLSRTPLTKGSPGLEEPRSDSLSLSSSLGSAFVFPRVLPDCHGGQRGHHRARSVPRA